MTKNVPGCKLQIRIRSIFITDRISHAIERHSMAMTTVATLLHELDPEMAQTIIGSATS
jgi:hypothetical protein